MNTIQPFAYFFQKTAHIFLTLLTVILTILLTSCDVTQGKENVPSAMPMETNHVAASAKGRIDIEGGVIRLAARRDGIISSVMVEEGARVQPGQVLATLDDTLAQSQLTLTRSEISQAAQEVNKARLHVQATKREVNRLKPLADRKVVPRQEYDQARDALALAQVDLNAANAVLGTAKAREQVALTEVEEHKIIAPLEGQIIQRQARPGNGVSTLNVTPLFLFMPDVPHIVRVELDEQFLTSVHVGQKMEIMLEVSPDEKRLGEVLRIGQVVGQRTPTDDPQEKQDSRIVEVVVSLENQDFLIGQRVIVRFLKSE